MRLILPWGYFVPTFRISQAIGSNGRQEPFVPPLHIFSQRGTAKPVRVAKGFVEDRGYSLLDNGRKGGVGRGGESPHLRPGTIVQYFHTPTRHEISRKLQEAYPVRLLLGKKSRRVEKSNSTGMTTGMANVESCPLQIPL